MNTAIQYDMGTLLGQVGAQPPRYGRGKWTCPECGHDTLSVNLDKQVFHCFYSGCAFSGGKAALRQRLGLRRDWLPRHEYIRLRREREQAHDAALMMQEEKAAKARRLGEEIWAKATPAPETHPYLVEKKVKPYGLRVWAGQLVIPVRDVNGVLHSLQLISPTGDKQFLYGGRVAGCAFGIGKLGTRIFLAEGFATGATVFGATGEAVAIAFFAGNLDYVAGALRGSYPTAELIIAGDNDWEKPENPGLTAAKATAQRFGVRAVWPVFAEGEQGSDFNDLAALVGTAAVRKHLRAALAL